MEGLYAAIAMLFIVAVVILLGHVSDEEKRGRRVHWAEWPLPEGEVGKERPEDVEIRRAA